jgi:hypothetical protein
MANWEIVVIAASAAGGAAEHVDTEDIAISASKIAPGRFSWKKYPEQIDIDAVRKRLWDARKLGLLLGSEREGWQLTESGTAFARKHKRSARLETSSRLSLNERRWRKAERLRLTATTTHAKYLDGNLSEITRREAEAFFRIDAYVSDSAIEDKILRVFNAFANDAELGPTVKHVAEIVRKNHVVGSHFRQKPR